MKDEPDLDRLCTAVYRSRLVLRKPRQVRVDMTREFVGTNWSEEGAEKPVLINLLAMYVNVVGRRLLSSNPRFMLSTWNRANKPIVSTMESWVNEEVVRTYLAGTFERCITDGLFNVGICKVSLATPADASLSAWTKGAGKPLAQRIDLDDFVCDMHARDFKECSYIGHRFRVPLAVVKNSKLYSREVRKDMSPMPDRIYNLEGDERIHLLGRTTLGGDEEEFEDFVDLWEIYLPRHRLVVTLLDGDVTVDAKGNAKAMRIQRWLGPDCGPYHMLGMGTVPGNIMPKAPMQDLWDLHLALNRQLRKLVRQADRQKENVFVRGGSTEDGSRAIDCNDGEVVRVDNPENLKAVTYGGPNAQNFQLFMALKDVFSWLSGNLEIMGGLAPQSKTAAQDKLMNENSSATIAQMQDRTTNFIGDVGRALCWYWHHDPEKVMTSEYALPGMPSMSITRKASPDDRQKVPFEDMKVTLDPYSLQHQTPQSRLAALNQIVTQIFIPMAQVAQSQGVALDFQAYLKIVGKLMDQPDLEEILTFQQAPAQQTGEEEGGGAEQPRMPQETTRTYERRSVGGQTGTAQGRGQEAITQMMAASKNGNGQQ